MLLRREDRMTGQPLGVIHSKRWKLGQGLKKPVVLMLEQDSREKTMGPQKKRRSRYAFGSMDVLEMLAEMRQERARIEEAIIALERLARGQGKRRGRPPAWMAAASATKRRGRPPGSKNQPGDKAADQG
jgi:hypothetical protein